MKNKVKMEVGYIHRIDPPSGWRYGFPKILPNNITNTLEWLVDNGYPQEEIDKFGDQFVCRHWIEEEGTQ